MRVVSIFPSADENGIITVAVSLFIRVMRSNETMNFGGKTEKKKN